MYCRRLHMVWNDHNRTHNSVKNIKSIHKEEKITKKIKME